MLRNLGWVFIGLTLIGAGGLARGEDPYNVVWSRQVGTAASESGRTAVDPSGFVYLGGSTAGSLYGPSSGSSDIFLNRYDTSGSLLWSRQFGTSASEGCSAIAVDGAGNAYLCGSTDGSLGGPNAGSNDAFVAKYDSAGNQVWARQLGTSGTDLCNGVALDTFGNLYISGYTAGDLANTNAGEVDLFLSKFDNAGNQLWSRQLGTSLRDEAWSVATDSAGNAYVGGLTDGVLSGSSGPRRDAFLIKYDPAGSLAWTRQFGGSSDFVGLGVAVDGSDNAFLTGTRLGIFSPSDAFLNKYDSDGGLLWSQILGTGLADLAGGVAVDDLGNAFITGYTQGNLGGPNFGASDVFLSKYDSSGNRLWNSQIGTSSSDQGLTVALDALGRVYVAGVTSGSLAGPSSGDTDAFLVKFAPVPEPSTLALLAAGACSLFFSRSMRRKR